MAILLLVVTVGTSISIWRVTAARQAEQREREKAERANQDLVVANRRLAGAVQVLEFQRAEDLFRSGDPAAGVAHLAASLRRDPTHRLSGERLLSALAHRDWLLPAAPPIAAFHPAEQARFSPDGRHVLVRGRDLTARLYAADIGELVASYSHAQRILASACSPDGQHVVTASQDGTARVWNATNGRPVTPPLSHRGRVSQAEFSPDGRTVLTASADRLARIWEVTNGSVRRELRGHSSAVGAARFSSDGRLVATGGEGGSVRLWDADTGGQRFRCENRRARLTALEFSADGRRLAWAGENGGAQLWDPSTGERVGALLAHARPDETVWAVAFSPNGRHVVTIGQDGSARTWSAVDGQFVGERRAHDAGIGAVNFSADGRLLATASRDNSARVWHLGRNLPLGQPLREARSGCGTGRRLLCRLRRGSLILPKPWRERASRRAVTWSWLRAARWLQ